MGTEPENTDAKQVLVSVLFPPFFYIGVRGSKQRAVVNIWQAQCPAQKRILHMNMDESCVPVWWPSKVGLVRAPEGGSRRQVLEQEQTATLTIRRVGFTLMACVADDPAIQRLLPQMVWAKRF